MYNIIRYFMCSICRITHLYVYSINALHESEIASPLHELNHMGTVFIPGAPAMAMYALGTGSIREIATVSLFTWTSSCCLASFAQLFCIDSSGGGTKPFWDWVTPRIINVNLGLQGSLLLCNFIANQLNMHWGTVSIIAVVSFFLLALAEELSRPWRKRFFG